MIRLSSGIMINTHGVEKITEKCIHFTNGSILTLSQTDQETIRKYLESRSVLFLAIEDTTNIFFRDYRKKLEDALWHEEVFIEEIVDKFEKSLRKGLDREGSGNIC